MIDYGTAAGTLDRNGIMRWRKAERLRLIAAPLKLSTEERRRHAAAIARHLTDALREVEGRTVAVYWPFRGEPSLRSWMEQMHACGAQCALPVVVEKRAPLVFRTWWPGAPMASGIWNIPVPAEGIDVLPDIVVSPVVGFDPACYRLGYGGGFYDRTLAAMARKPLVIGVGFAVSAVATIHPLPHDIPMHFIVTERVHLGTGTGRLKPTVRTPRLATSGGGCLPSRSPESRIRHLPTSVPPGAGAPAAPGRRAPAT